MSRLPTLFLALLLPIAARATPISDILGDRQPAEIRRIIPSETPENLRMADLEFIAAFEVIGTPTPLTPDQAATAQALTSDPESFDPDGEATCKFRPGIALRFGDAGNAIDLLVCFACDEVATVPVGKEVTQLATMPQPSRDVLLTLAKTALPEDQAIQDLPDVRREGSAPAPFAPAAPTGPLGQ